MNGGHLRVFHLLRQLGTRFDEVHAVVGQSAAAVSAAGDAYPLPPTIRLYSPVESPPPRDVFDLLPGRITAALRYRWLRRSVQGPASNVFLSMYHLVERVLRRHTIDTAVFEHLDAMYLAPLVHRVSPRTRCILDAHNVEFHLLRQLLEKDPGNRSLQRHEQRVRREESNLEREVDAFVACSEADRETLERANEGKVPGFTVPNGVDTQQHKYDARADKRMRNTLLFCGALTYPPNVDGLLWFVERVWPQVQAARPGVRLRVIGRCNGVPKALEPVARDPTIDFIGSVPEVAPHYAESSISIVPLHQGSGTRLKILEAMALGTPVVSTSKGAEGIELDGMRSIRIADDPQSFTDGVARLLEDEDLFEEQRRAARLLVETRYDWSVVAQHLFHAIEYTVAATARGEAR